MPWVTSHRALDDPILQGVGNTSSPAFGNRSLASSRFSFRLHYFSGPARPLPSRLPAGGVGLPGPATLHLAAHVLPHSGLIKADGAHAVAPRPQHLVPAGRQARPRVPPARGHRASSPGCVQENSAGHSRARESVCRRLGTPRPTEWRSRHRSEGRGLPHPTSNRERARRRSNPPVVAECAPSQGTDRPAQRQTPAMHGRSGGCDRGTRSPCAGRAVSESCAQRSTDGWAAVRPSTGSGWWGVAHSIRGHSPSRSQALLADNMPRFRTVPSRYMHMLLEYAAL